MIKDIKQYVKDHYNEIMIYILSIVVIIVVICYIIYLNDLVNTKPAGMFNLSNESLESLKKMGNGVR